MKPAKTKRSNSLFRVVRLEDGQYAWESAETRGGKPAFGKIFGVGRVVSAGRVSTEASKRAMQNYLHKQYLQQQAVELADQQSATGPAQAAG